MSTPDRPIERGDVIVMPRQPGVWTVTGEYLTQSGERWLVGEQQNGRIVDRRHAVAKLCTRARDTEI